MPFKTGLGTAGGSIMTKKVRASRMFQCPLRRAWVLRDNSVVRLETDNMSVSMPFKTGLGTAGTATSQRNTGANKVSMPFKTGLGTAGTGKVKIILASCGCFNAL